ncbi:MAG: transcription antitermination factor NusB [Actinomycetota bacterium]|nr:transcription antitermination factor NusB [Actinomycetota bacterium]
MATRREGRRIAIDILYQADITDTASADVMTSWEDAGRSVPGFARGLVEGVAEFGPGIDLLLEEHAEDWTVARMPPVDRTILRVAVYELLHSPDVPPSVAISEAVEAASDLSADESKRFVNGVLGRIARESKEEQK